MAISKKTGRIIKPKSLSQKLKASATRKHNLAFGITKPRKKKK
jgi:hypothetical protein